LPQNKDSIGPYSVIFTVFSNSPAAGPYRALGTRLVKSKMAANLSNFQSYLEYFEYYIRDIVYKMFGSTVGESRLIDSGEISHENLCVLLNTARTRRNSDIIIKTNRSLEVSFQLSWNMLLRN
jgi:hypothetical protein